ncbi:hypothetical protein DQ353_12615 [Arthrobacter sp. AQ5-05]|nr:hypothetical protein DQ353_12615 [Arthrobacter sp. AQ5-05]
MGVQLTRLIGPVNVPFLTRALASFSMLDSSSETYTLRTARSTPSEAAAAEADAASSADAAAAAADELAAADEAAATCEAKASSAAFLAEACWVRKTARTTPSTTKTAAITPQRILGDSWFFLPKGFPQLGQKLPETDDWTLQKRQMRIRTGSSTELSALLSSTWNPCFYFASE